MRNLHDIRIFGCPPKGIWVLAILLLNTAIYGQLTISGVVTDAENGDALIGVNVLEKGTSNGAVTDLDGSYSISVTDAGATLVFSYTGYAEQEITVGQQSTIDVQLSFGVGIEEVIVVGYGTQRKQDVTGAVATLKGDDLIKAPTTNLTNSLNGKLPGVLSIQTSGQPGFDDGNFQIRGVSTLNNNEPLVLVDGVVRPFSRINPAEIASISVLKDAASTAIYGARAANGVLLITTRRGAEGAPQFKFNSSVAFQSPTRRPKLMNGSEYVLYFREALLNEGADPSTLPLGDLLSAAEAGNVPSYDWWGSTLTDSAPQQQHGFSVSGGNERVKYFASYGLLDQDGLLDLSSFKSNSIRSNIDITLAEGLVLGVDLAGRLETALRSADDDSEIFSNALRANPLNPVFLDGQPGAENLPAGSLGFDGFSGNAYGDANLNGYQRNQNNVLQSNLSLTYALPWVTGLKARALYSYDFTNSKNKQFFKPYTYYTQNPGTGVWNKSQSDNNIFLEEVRTDLVQQTTQLGLTYDKTMGAHKLGVLGLFEQIETNGDMLSAYRDRFISASIDQLFAGSVDNDSNTGSAFETARRGFVSRVTYDYKGKYLFQANARIDQSFNFPREGRTGFFPAFSVGWRISDEAFMSGSDLFDNLKLRASWGQVGNDRVPAFQFLEGFIFNGGVVVDGKYNLGIQDNGIPNPNITWETATSTDIGLEGSVLNGKINFEVGYYTKRTEDILTSRSLSVPLTFGASLPDENIGIVDSWGWEAAAFHNNRLGDLRYTIGANITTANNKIIFQDEPSEVLERISATGKRIGFITGYLSDGLFQSQAEIDAAPTQFGQLFPGDIKYKDLNGDGVINQNDLSVIGNGPTPDLVYGFNVDLSYKSFDFFAAFQGASGFSRFIQPLGFLLSVGNSYQVLTDSWSPQNTDAAYPRIVPDGTANNNVASDFWVQNINYLRLRNMELGYTLDTDLSFVESLGIQYLRIYLNGTNLFTLTNRTIGDPEGPDDVLFYPQVRTVGFGINVGL